MEGFIIIGGLTIAFYVFIYCEVLNVKKLKAIELKTGSTLDKDEFQKSFL